MLLRNGYLTQAAKTNGWMDEWFSGVCLSMQPLLTKRILIEGKIVDFYPNKPFPSSTPFIHPSISNPRLIYL